jgi:hypothetical protein
MWRVFPWEPSAPDGAPFSPTYITPEQDGGRFDLGGDPAVLNLGETPAHAVAEQIQARHGQRLTPADLMDSGKPLALVEVSLALGPKARLADLSDPEELKRLGCRPDELMSDDLRCTQSISRRLHQAGLTGFRVWSALSGDWHCTMLFMDRAGESARLTFGQPSRLHMDHPAVREAAAALDISLARADAGS